MEYEDRIISGIISLFDNFHPDAVLQRRELLMAIKYILQSELRTKFISVVPRLTNETLLLGPGFTSQDNLRLSLIFIFNPHPFV